MDGAAALPLQLRQREDRLSRVLLEDGALVLAAEGPAIELVQPWLPRFPIPSAPPARRDAARITVTMTDAVTDAPDRPDPCIEVLGLRGWADDPDHISLLTLTGTLSGSLDLSTAHARIRVLQGEQPGAVRDVFCALTVAAALLLGRRGRILLHSAAFVAPGGAAWLLVGESQSGKSSTCANLIRHGWNYLADDQIVIGGALHGSLRAEGWPRVFNLDNGFSAGLSTGQRSPADPRDFGRGDWCRAAPLGGMLFPRVAAERPTALAPLARTDALQEIIRQSPWLLADAGAAPALLARMLEMVELPAYRLILGRDSYGEPAALAAVLRPVVDRPVKVAVAPRRVVERKRTL